MNVNNIDYAKGNDIHINSIIISGEDADFLIKLAHTRNTQDKDCCADPVYWMIQDQKNVYAEDGEFYEFYGDGELLYSTYDEFNKENLEEFKEYILNSVSYLFDFEGFKKISNNNELIEYIEFFDIKSDDITISRFDREYFLSYSSGPFLTKEVAKQHLKDNYYHYSKNARTYGLVGWRNPEFEKLMDIISKLDVEVKNV